MKIARAGVVRALEFERFILACCSILGIDGETKAVNQKAREENIPLGILMGAHEHKHAQC